MDDQAASLVGILIGVIVLGMFLALLILFLVGLWRVFEKAARPGWGALIPIYNLLLAIRIAGRPDIWVLLVLVPALGFIFQLIVAIDLAKTFGKGTGFALGLFFLPFIFVPILGFGDARYLGPQAAQASLQGPPGGGPALEGRPPGESAM